MADNAMQATHAHHLREGGGAVAAETERGTLFVNTTQILEWKKRN
jgi:hypothetical protein